MRTPNSTTDHSPRSKGVLICDDEPLMRQLLATIIETRDGLHVAGQAVNGVEAISEAERLQPAVIILDLSMPQLTGLDALPEIKRVTPDALVLVFSGFAAAVVASDVLALGADHYLEKGASPALITKTIEDLIQARAELVSR